MGCGCKNQVVQEKTPIIKQDSGALEIVNPAPPPYTWEEVIAVKDALRSNNSTEQTRDLIINFNREYFGEIIPGYCDQNCRKRTEQRLERATELLNQWEQIKNKK